MSRRVISVVPGPKSWLDYNCRDCTDVPRHWDNQSQVKAPPPRSGQIEPTSPPGRSVANQIGNRLWCNYFLIICFYTHIVIAFRTESFIILIFHKRLFYFKNKHWQPCFIKQQKWGFASKKAKLFCCCKMTWRTYCEIFSNHNELAVLLDWQKKNTSENVIFLVNVHCAVTFYMFLF